MRKKDGRGGRRSGAGRPEGARDGVRKTPKGRPKHCQNCGHEWWARDPTKAPARCPSCNSKDWKKVTNAGRPKGAKDRATASEKEHVSLIARLHTSKAVDALVRICTKGTNERAIVMAAVALLNRGFGNPPQSQKIEWGGGERISVAFIDAVMRGEDG